MPANSPESSQSRQTGNLSSLPQETLVDYLFQSINRLETTCLPPQQLARQSLLWFHPHEYEVVNSVWQSSGLRAVTEKWGEARTFASGESVDIWSQPRSSSEPLPQKPSILIVNDYALNNSPESVRAAPFRSATFAATDADKTNVIEALAGVGLLDKALPVADQLTGAPLRGCPIVDVKLRATWHASSHGRSGKTDFVISLTIAPAGYDEEVLSLTLSGGGQMFRSIFVESLVETGYEGHGLEKIDLSPDELRALLAVVNSVSTERTESPSPFQMGTWLGWTLPEQ